MMPLPKFTLEKPQTLTEALQLLADSPDALPLSGGTDLLVSMKQGLYTPERLIDLKNLKELIPLEISDKGAFLGAGLKLATIRDNARIREYYPALSEAAGMVASPNIQNMGTLGGNVCLDTRCWYFNQSEFWRNSTGYCLKKEGDICRAAPSGKRCFAVFSSDTVPALIALGARAELAHWDGTAVLRQEVPLEQLYREDGINRMTVKHGELLVGIHLPASNRLLSGFMKYRTRGAIDYPLASVAVALRMVAGTMRDVRIVLGALASSPVIAFEAMELLEGAQPSPELIARAVERVGKRVCPVKNQAGSPAHRKQMARIYCQRLLVRLTE
ncbi:MAG: FAD binding domain-containing protein [Desulfuromonadaceae bacterium]